MYLTLTDVKKHLQIDDSFTDDDNYILSLIQVAEDSVSKHLDIALKDLIAKGQLPSAIRQSILLMVGNLYNNRESVSYGSPKTIPYNMEYLIGLYKHYYIP